MNKLLYVIIIFITIILMVLQRMFQNQGYDLYEARGKVGMIIFMVGIVSTFIVSICFKLRMKYYNKNDEEDNKFDHKS